MEALTFSLSLSEIPCGCSFRNDSGTTLSFEASGNRLTVSVYYDYSTAPLCLRAAVSAGDRVLLTILPYRIDLSVNGKTEDEEWPVGNLLFSKDDSRSSGLPVSVERKEYVKEPEPDVLGTFRGAEGWKPEENVFVGDCMPYVHQGKYHVLYLKDRHHHRSKWGLGAHQWEHISTSDFENWSVHPMAVPITDPLEGSICTGSWISSPEKEYLFYTVRRGGDIPAPIRRSVSSDGYHFEKDEDFGFILPERYRRFSARDPKVFSGADGFYHMFVTTSDPKLDRGCLAHLVSTDLDHWNDTEEPIFFDDIPDEPECSDYICYGGFYYLIYSQRGTRYRFSDKPFSDFREPNDPIIPCASVPKGAVWDNRIVFAGFLSDGGYAGTMTFRSAVSDENGELRFLPKEQGERR